MSYDQSICGRYIATPTLSLFHSDDSEVRAVLGGYGCFAGHTEYLTPYGWRRIDEYDGGLVGQFKNGLIEFVMPSVYHDYKADAFYRFSHNGYEMTLSEYHNMVLWDGSRYSKLSVHDYLYSGKRPHGCIPFLTNDYPVKNIYIPLISFNIERCEAGDRMYCFTVESGMLVMRENDRIFITGNSGKSTAMCMEILKRASEMPADHNGIRSSKWAVIRATYPELTGTSAKTWKKVVGDDFRLVMSNREVPHADLRWGLSDGTHLDLRLEFFAADTPAHVDKLGSYEITGAWINECKEVSKKVFEAVTGRIGRYPGVVYNEDGVRRDYWYGVIMDTNPPDTEHWFYDLFENQRPEGYKLWKQPPPLLLNERDEWTGNPLAENIQFLPGGIDYYLKMARGKDTNWINVYINGQYGTLMDGKPVYPMFSSDEHIEDYLPVHPDIEIVAGVDPGLNNAVIFGQMLPGGRLNIVGEVFREDITVRDFIAEELKPYIVKKFRNIPIEWVGDPALNTRSASDGGTAYKEYLTAGITLRPAKAREIDPRVQAVTSFLNRRDGFKIAGGECPWLLRGLLGEYCYERILTGRDKYRDKPTKGRTSHICNSLEFLCLEFDPQYSRDFIKEHYKNRKKKTSKKWGF